MAKEVCYNGKVFQDKSATMEASEATEAVEDGADTSFGRNKDLRTSSRGLLEVIRQKGCGKKVTENKSKKVIAG